MKFIFVCPIQNKVFESPDFRIMENRGVITDAAGKKTLNAKLSLENSCPLCGSKHVYHASELFVRSPAWMVLKRIRLMELNKKVKLTATVTGSG